MNWSLKYSLAMIALILGNTFEFELPNSCNLERIFGQNWCRDAISESVIVDIGSQYIDTECSAYVVPHNSLSALPCPLNLTIISEENNSCYQIFYSNQTIRVVNIKVILPPTPMETGIDLIRQPLNGKILTLICPLYGFPSLEYSWSIRFYDDNDFIEFNASQLYREESTSLIETRSDYYKILPDKCSPGLIVYYYFQYKIDGDYYCTGRNKYGSKTMLVTSVNNGSLCFSKKYEEISLKSTENLISGLEKTHKVSSHKFGRNVTLNCKIMPFANTIRMTWVKTIHLNSIKSLCMKNFDSELQTLTLASDSKYTISSHLHSETGRDPERPQCIKTISLTIHDFSREDEAEYSCIAQMCLPAISGKLNVGTVDVTSDTNRVRRYRWIFSLLSIPIVLIIIVIVLISIVVYLNKLRLIQWYIGWTRAEPKGEFEYDVFICKSEEEYNGYLVQMVKSEIINQTFDIRILWSENQDCSLAGRNHYSNAKEILDKCKKFLFIVDENFKKCCFCKQLVELVVEKSSVENTNIILPIKWSEHVTVPKELNVYRYVERLQGKDYFNEIYNFINGYNVMTRIRRRSTYLYRVMVYSRNEEARPLNDA